LNNQQVKALNQLVSVLSGGIAAKATNDLASAPLARIDECLRLTLEEMSQAVMQGDMKLQKQSTRKLESLQSLRTLAEAL